MRKGVLSLTLTPSFPAFAAWLVSDDVSRSENDEVAETAARRHRGNMSNWFSTASSKAFFIEGV
jgi:hypothetical protein